MTYRELLRLEGIGSIVLGLELALVAFPGLILSYSHGWTGILFVPAALAVIALWGSLRHGARLSRPGEWLTKRSLEGARPGGAALDPAPIRRRLLIETAAWIIGVTLWVLFGRSSGLLIFGTGLASAAYGALQLSASRGRVAEVERASATTFYVARRPGFGTPDLTTAAAAPRRGTRAARR